MGERLQSNEWKGSDLEARGGLGVGKSSDSVATLDIRSRMVKTSSTSVYERVVKERLFQIQWRVACEPMKDGRLGSSKTNKDGTTEIQSMDKAIMSRC